MDELMLSVWIVTYNHEAYIRQCLESVVSQQVNFRYEIVIGEDHSTDGTRAIIEEYVARYPDLFRPVFHAQNVGAYRNAYEFCYPMLGGRYIACLEGDDYWTDLNKLQKQVDLLEAHPELSLCFTQVEVLRETDAQLEKHWSVGHNRKTHYKLADILQVFNIVTCTLVFRNIYPRELPYDPLSYPTGDVALSVHLLLEGDGFFLNEITAVYRLHAGGVFSPQNLEKKNLVFLKIFERLLESAHFEGQRSLIRQLLSDRAYQALCFEIKKEEPDRGLARQYRIMATRHFSSDNMRYPLKAVLRHFLYQLTGKSFGRKLTE